MTRPSRFDYEPAELVPPGETLTEWLDHQGMTQAEFARRTNLTPKHISQVVRGGVGISPEVALAFERVTAIPARYWTQLDANYQTAKQRLAETGSLEAHIDLVDQFPVRQLQKRGHLRKGLSKLEKLQGLLELFGVADPSALEDVWLRPAMYRQSRAFKADPGALATWLRLAEMQAAQVAVEPFDASDCRSAIEKMRELSTLPGVEWLEPLKELCASVGIALVILKELPRCRINGATRWLSPHKAMIALSLRHRRSDIFWFTLFHELCHILRHSKKETFVDAKGSSIDDDLEREADTFAARVLIPPPCDRHLQNLSTAKDVERFASTIGVAAGIVVGRMQHDDLIPHGKWSSLITRYRFIDD